MDEREPTVRAWVRRHDADVLRAAVADAPAGPLRGFTLGVKDVIDTADLATERNSSICVGRQPSADAAAVALARAAGAVVAGKTVTTEYAYFSPGPTTNPHDPTRTPGGSSSGSAAAVAAGMCRIAFGTQTGGSVIRPASFCGVIGFKPTFDLVPFTGVSPVAPSFDTLGWYGRTLDDIGAVLDALAPAGAASRATAPPRLGLYLGHHVDEADEVTLAELARIADVLRAAGIEVVELDPFEAFAPLRRAHQVIMATEASRALSWERIHHADELSPQLTTLITEGLAIGADEYRAAQEATVAARAFLAERLDTLGLDALLTLAAPGEAPIGLASTGSPVFNLAWTMLRLPCLTLPLATGDHGLPIGVQLVGRRWHDRDLLATAAAVHAATA